MASCCLIRSSPSAGIMAPCLLVVVRTPLEMIEDQTKTAVALGTQGEHLDAGGDHLGADAVSRDGGDPVLAHELLQRGQWRTPNAFA